MGKLGWLGTKVSAYFRGLLAVVYGLFVIQKSECFEKMAVISDTSTHPAISLEVIIQPLIDVN